MKNAIATLLMSFLLVPATAFGHEGHSHGAEKPAPNGGELRDNKSLQMELVKLDNGLNLYFHSNDLETPISPKKVKIQKITVKGTKRKKKDRGAKYKIEGDHIKITFKKDKSYKYDVSVVAAYKGKKQKKVKWQIEP